MKKNIFITIPFFALFLIFNIIAFAIGNPATLVFWSAYLLNAISFIAVLICSKMLKKESNYLFNLITITPLMTVSVVFYLLQSGMSLIFIAFKNVNIKLPIAFESIVLILYFLIIAFLLLYKKNANSMILNQESINNNIFKANLLNSVENLQSKNYEPIIHIELNKLYDQVEFSIAPFSTTESELIENEINEKISTLENLLTNKKYELALSTIKEIVSMLNQRNSFCQNRSE